MDFKERLTLGGESYTNWNPVQDFRSYSSFYCDSPVSYGQRLTAVIRQHDVAWWLWSIFDHTKQDCNNETMNHSWSPELVSITKKIYLFTWRFKITHRKGDLLLLAREFETEKACIVVLSPLIVLIVDLTAIFCGRFLLFKQESEILNWGLVKTGLREIKRHAPVVFSILLWPEDN